MPGAFNNLTFEQLTSIGAGIAAIFIGAYTAWRGYWSKKSTETASSDFIGAVSRLETVLHQISEKLDELIAIESKIYTDTQVLRDRKP